MVFSVRCEVHPSSARLKRFIVSAEYVRRRFRSGSESAEPLELPAAFCGEVRSTLLDRRFAGSVIEYDDSGELDEAVLAAFCDSLVAGIGSVIPETLNTDARPMPAVDHVQIFLAHDLNPPQEGLHFNNPELAWPLHTDRALHEDPGDFVLVCKAVEDNASGGRIRLLHLDDLEHGKEFIEHPLAGVSLTWKGEERFAHLRDSRAARESSGVRAPVFTGSGSNVCIRFTDSRFRRPDTLEQLEYLHALNAAIAERAERIPAFVLPVRGIYVVNNRYVLHGREGFRNEPQFRRKLLRYCGNL